MPAPISLKLAERCARTLSRSRRAPRPDPGALHAYPGRVAPGWPCLLGSRVASGHSQTTHRAIPGEAPDSAQIHRVARSTPGPQRAVGAARGTGVEATPSGRHGGRTTVAREEPSRGAAAMAMRILQVSFSLENVTLDEYDEVRRSSSASIVAAPGLQCKVWIVYEAERVFFVDLIAQLREPPFIPGLQVRKFVMMPEHSAVTRAAAKSGRPRHWCEVGAGCAGPSPSAENLGGSPHDRRGAVATRFGCAAPCDGPPARRRLAWTCSSPLFCRPFRRGDADGRRVRPWACWRSMPAGGAPPSPTMAGRRRLGPRRRARPGERDIPGATIASGNGLRHRRGIAGGQGRAPPGVVVRTWRDALLVRRTPRHNMLGLADIR